MQSKHIRFLESDDQVEQYLRLSSLQHAYENEWQVKVYMPFFDVYKHLITDYSHVYTNPNLVTYLLSRVDLIIDWCSFSRNTGLNIEIISSYMQYEWYWRELSNNPGITMQAIINHPEYPWNWYNGVSRNPNLNISIIKQFSDKNWDWTFVSSNPGITMQDIINHPEYPWDWSYGVSRHPNMTMNMIIQNSNKLWSMNDQIISPNHSANVCANISSNTGITMQDIINHPEYPWDWYYGVGRNPNLTFSMTKLYRDKTWCWNDISSNSGITTQDIINHPYYPWRWEGVCHNPNLNLDILKLYYMNLRDLSSKPGISMQDLINHPKYNCDWCGVSRNPNLTVRMIKQYPHKKWNWDIVFQNPFTKDKELYVNNQMVRLLLVYMMDDYNNLCPIF